MVGHVLSVDVSARATGQNLNRSFGCQPSCERGSDRRRWCRCQGCLAMAACDLDVAASELQIGQDGVVQVGVGQPGRSIEAPQHRKSSLGARSPRRWPVLC